MQCACGAVVKGRAIPVKKGPQRQWFPLYGGKESVLKVRKSSLVMLAIIYCLAFQCRWLVIAGLNTSISYYVERILYILMFLYCKLGKSPRRVMQPYYRKIDRAMVVVSAVGMVELLYTIGAGMAGPYAAMKQAVYAYIKILAVYPLLYLMVFCGYKKTEKVIVLVGAASMVYQAVTAMLYDISGMVLNNRLIANDGWSRNGNIRLNSTGLFWILFIIWFCKAMNEKRAHKKSADLLWSIFAMAFMLFVNQSRSLYVAAIGAAMLAYLGHEGRSRRKVVSVIALFVLIVLFTQSSVFNQFMASFAKGSENDTLTGRLRLLNLIQQVKRNLLFGFGFVGNTVEVSGEVFYFIDYGLLGDLLQLGIFALICYGTLGLILLKNAAVLARYRGFGFDFTVGAIAFLLLGSIGFSVLPEARNFAIPVVLAISQYSAVNCIKHADDATGWKELTGRRNMI